MICENKNQALRFPRVKNLELVPILGLWDCPEWKAWQQHSHSGSEITQKGKFGAGTYARALRLPRVERMAAALICTKALRLPRVENLELVPLLGL